MIWKWSYSAGKEVVALMKYLLTLFSCWKVSFPYHTHLCYNIQCIGHKVTSCGQGFIQNRSREQVFHWESNHFVLVENILKTWIWRSTPVKCGSIFWVVLKWHSAKHCDGWLSIVHNLLLSKEEWLKNNHKWYLKFVQQK